MVLRSFAVPGRIRSSCKSRWRAGESVTRGTKIRAMHQDIFFSPPSRRLALMALAGALLGGCASPSATTQPSVADAPTTSPPSSATTPVPAPAPAPLNAIDTSPAERQQAFAKWVADFRAAAGEAGIGEATLRLAFDKVQYLPRVIELDRAQPEFTRAVWDYLDGAVSARRVAEGQDKLLQVRC